MREQFRQQLPPGQDLHFFQRVALFDAPENMWEGIGKGLLVGALTTSILLTMDLIEFNPETAQKVLLFYLACMLIFASWGLNNEAEWEERIRRAP